MAYGKDGAVDRLLNWFFDGGWVMCILPGLVALTIILALATGNSGMTEVQPGEVAVKYNTLSGEATVVQQQGLLAYLPLFQKVEKLSLEPQVFVMEGNHNGPNRAPMLRVRANDGSMFTFPKMETHYQVIPGLADKVISCYGPGAGYTHDVIPTVTREVYRNEFGRFNFLEIADPSSYGTATAKAKVEINKKLHPCGLMVSHIVTPKPDFNGKVEQAIEDRQNAEQAVEVQTTKRERLAAQKDRLVQEVQQQGNEHYQTLKAVLEAGLKEAENNAAAKRRDADKYVIDTVAACEAARDAKVTRALGNEEAYRKDAEGLAANIRAVGSQGPQVLNLEIARTVIPQVQGVKARPYSRANQPLDIRTLSTVLDATDGE